MAFGALAALPLISAEAAATDVVFSVATGASAPAVTITAYPTTAGGVPNGGTVKTLTGSAANPSTLTIAGGVGATTLTAATYYKFKVSAAGFQTRWLTGTTATAANVQTLTTTAAASFSAATAFTNNIGTDEFNFGTQSLTAAGAVAPTVAISSVVPINNDGSLGTGSPAIGQKARITVSVTAAAQSPSGFVSLDGGTAFTPDGSQMATLTAGAAGTASTATIDAIVTGAAGTTKTAIVGYGGDANVAPGTVTKSDIAIAGGMGTLTGVVNIAGPTVLAGATVTAYTNPTTGSPVVAGTATTDAAGAWRLTLPNSAVDGYKLRYSKTGHLSEWEATAAGADNGLATFTAGGFQVLNSDAPTALSEIILVVGATAPAIAVTTSPSSPRVGQTVTYSVTVTGAGAVGAVNFSDGTVSTEKALASVGGNGTATLTKTFSAVGAQAVTIAFTGDGTRAAGTQSVSVTIVAGAVLTGIVSNASGVVSAATVNVYDANTGAELTGSPLTTDAAGMYEIAAPAGVYRIRAFKTGHISEWNTDKATFGAADQVAVAGATVNVNFTLAAWGVTALGNSTKVLTPTAPIAGQPFSAVVTMSNVAATGTIYLTGQSPTTAVALASGVATINVPTWTAGTPLTVVYSGDATYTGGTITVTGNIPTYLLVTSTTITSNVPTVRSGQNVVLTATTRLASGAVAGTGTVTFKKGTTTLGTAAAATAGVYAITYAPAIGTDGITAGSNAITAEYTATGTEAGSVSAPLNQTVVANQGKVTTVTPFRALEPTALGAAATTDLTFSNVPAGAVAVQLNVTVSGVSANTYVSVCPGGTATDTCKASSTVNTAGPDTRNFAIVPLGGAGTDTVKMYNNAGSVLVSADVFGWVIASPGTDGSISIYSPARFGDAIPFGPASVSTVTFDDVPAGATAIALNVTIAGVSGNTYVSACTPATTTAVCKDKSIINSNGADKANFVIVPLGGPAMNKVKFYNNAGTVNQLLLDVAGYVVGTPSAVSAGRFQVAGPNRLITPTTIPAGSFANVTLTGVPAGATAIALNVTGAGVNANTYWSACPGNTPDATCKATSVLNSAGPDTAGFVIVQLGAGNTLKLYNNAGTPLAIGDLLGWVIG